MEEKVVFFDLDGTLVDHETAAKSAAVLFLRENRSVLNFDEDVFAGMWYRLAEEYFEYYTLKKMTYEEQKTARIKAIWKKMNRKITDDEAAEKYAVFLKLYEQKWKLFGDALPCLDSLRGCRLGVISNGDFDNQVKKLKALKIHERFDVVVTSELLGAAKPDKRIFAEACGLAGVNPHEAVMTGDSLLKDARGAKEAGMRGIWLDRKNESLGIEGVDVIKSLDELAGVL